MKAMNLVSRFKPANVDAKKLMMMLGASALLLGLSAEASASTSMMSFPIIDDILCGFLAYSRTKLAPLIAVIVIIFSVVGHWLGSGKMWSTLLYVGLGLGLILGIGTAVANFTGVGNSCIA